MNNSEAAGRLDEGAAVGDRADVGVENGELDSVKTDQAIERGEPEVPVLVLGGGGDGIIWQAVSRLPCGHDILRLAESDRPDWRGQAAPPGNSAGGTARSPDRIGTRVGCSSS